MKNRGITAAALMGAVTAALTVVAPADADARTASRRMDVEFQAAKPAGGAANAGARTFAPTPDRTSTPAPTAAPAGARPIPRRMREASPFPLYLKAFNDTHTPGQLYQRLGAVTSSEWKTWYASTHRRVPLHRTSVEFLQRESFLVRTPGTMSLLNTTRMDEGVLVISRRPFPFTRDEKFTDIAARLSRVDVRQRYESRLPFLKLFELLLRAPVSWADNPSETAVRIAPAMALIDIARARVQCLDVLEEVPNRGPASAPLTTDCRRALAEQRQLADPGRGGPSVPAKPSRRLIVETAPGPSPITGPGTEAPSAAAATSRAPAATYEAPVAYEGVGRD